MLLKSVGLLILCFADEQKGTSCALTRTYSTYKTELETSLSRCGIVRRIVRCTAQPFAISFGLCVLSPS